MAFTSNGIQGDGVEGILCGPSAVTTQERVVDIPITAFRVDKRLLMDAINKTRREALTLLP